ncbi:sensor histidine kinase [Lentibacillus saliphilus]|uniref:sensor histidine kinase n=1 Tax=Lentibacillus saliphilus TaxID=2737028 RepID=UPI001C2F3A3F|nr:histidine kinase [Lentibacillus saliphilus]
MITLENLSFYIMICVLAPLIGAFTILFLFIFEKKMEALETKSRQLVLQQELQRNKFEILSQNIQPHFFFNTLNAIMGLARLDRKPELIHALETMSKFLKRKYVINESLATIADELTYTSYYLDIQKLRYGDRLNISKNIDPSVMQMLIPTYVIQTLVENSFKHGFEKYAGPASLIMTISATEKSVMMDIWNSKSDSIDTSNTHDDENHRKGIGLQNIKERLQILFPSSDSHVELVTDHEGTTVHVKWPIYYEDNKGDVKHEYTFSR